MLDLPLCDCVRPNDLQEAMKLLNGRRRQARPDTAPSRVAGTNKMPEAPTFKGTPNLFNMKIWLHALGHSVPQQANE